MKRKLLLFCIALFLATSMTVIGCPGPVDDEEPTVEPIRIGLLWDYSGMGSGDIPYHEDGVRIKLDEVGWEVAGRKIELKTADNAGDPVKGAEAARRLVETDKVDVVIGPVWGHVALAVAPVLAESKTPLVIPSGQSMDVLKAGAGNVFLIRGTFAHNAYYAGVYAYEDLGYRTAVVVHSDFVTGEEFLSGFMEPFEERGGAIVQTVKVPLGTFDFAPYLTAMQEADVVAIWLTPGELPSFYAQLDEFGLDMPVMYVSMTAQHEGWAAVGDLCIGTIGQHEYSTFLDNEANIALLNVLRAKATRAWTFQAAGYTAASVFLEAVKATEGDTTPDKINEALKKVVVDTPEGKISFTDEGVGIGDVLIVRVAKVDDRYEKEILKVYGQVVRKTPWE